MLYMLALSQSAGGVQVVNDRRAVVLKLPDNTAPEDALGVARDLAAAADPTNAPAWAGALGGFMSNDSLDILDGVLWLNVNPETPATLEGDPDEGGGDLPATSAIVADGQAITTPLNGVERTLTPTVAGNAITGLETAPTVAVVTDGQTLAVTGGTVTLTVAANAVTAEFTPE
ncbi:MAG: hypothetical protein WC313_00230 [Candidatus Kapaibacterium sp.]